MTEIGYITSVKGEYALVSFKRQSGCGHDCASCGGGCASAADVTTEIKNILGAKVGDRVKVEMKQEAYNKLLLWVYAFPLFMLVFSMGIGYTVFNSLGYSNSEILSLLLGLAALSISYTILHKISKKSAKKSEFTLQMTEIVK